MQKILFNFLSSIGSFTLSICHVIGVFSLFVMRIIIILFKGPFYLKNILAQIVEVGYLSLPVISLTSFFSGCVLALQSYSGFTRFGAESGVAAVVVLSLTRELIPVLCGLMIAGRVGASISAEIGTMKVTEQIDALVTLSTNPTAYLLMPRVLAVSITMPILVIIGDIIGVMGGYLVSVYSLGFNSVLYIDNTVDILELMDVVSGLVKAFCFGFIVASISCFHGYYTSKGAKGVGQSVTNSVVYSSIFILISNYFITALFF